MCHIKRHKSLVHRVKDEHWTTSLSSLKTSTFFDYNSGVSWSIFIIFVPVETGMNTLQKSLKNYVSPQCLT